MVRPKEKKVHNRTAETPPNSFGFQFTSSCILGHDTRISEASNFGLSATVRTNLISEFDFEKMESFYYILNEKACAPKVNRYRTVIVTVTSATVGRM